MPRKQNADVDATREFTSIQFLEAQSSSLLDSIEAPSSTVDLPTEFLLSDHATASKTRTHKLFETLTMCQVLLPDTGHS